MQKIVSPDGRVQGSLTEAGEIRYGPIYYHLHLPSCDFTGRIFGAVHLWSADSRYLAIQEWLTTNYADGPYTELLLIDFLSDRQCGLSKANKGFIVPLRFESSLLIYQKDYLERGESREYEIAYELLDRWCPLKKAL